VVFATVGPVVEDVGICVDATPNRSTVAALAVVYSSIFELVDALSPSSAESEPWGDNCPVAVPVFSTLAVAVVEVSLLIQFKRPLVK
jgi:hypothetical protein